MQGILRLIQSFCAAAGRLFCPSFGRPGVDHTSHMRREMCCIPGVFDDVLRVCAGGQRMSKKSGDKACKGPASKQARGDAKNQPQSLNGHQPASLMWKLETSSSEATILQPSWRGDEVCSRLAQQSTACRKCQNRSRHLFMIQFWANTCHNPDYVLNQIAKLRCIRR